jgi:hypothetical protein
LGKLEVIADFLPSPSELAFREEGVKVTLALSKKSIEFFKAAAAEHRTQYQRMIRKLLDAYVDAQTAAPEGSARRATEAKADRRLAGRVAGPAARRRQGRPAAPAARTARGEAIRPLRICREAAG